MSSRVGDMHYQRPLLARTRIEKDETNTRRLWRARRRSLLNAWAAAELTAAADGRFRPKLVSSVAGTFDRILLTMPSWLFAARTYANVYKDFFRKLPKRVQYVIVVSRSKRPTLNRWMRRFDLSGRVDVVEVSNRLDFTVWAEDPYVMVQDNGAGQSFFVEPGSFNRFADNRIADKVSDANTDLGLLPSKLVFQGGNILIGDDFWFIGADHPRISRIRRKRGETREEAVRRVYGQALDNDRKMHVIATDVKIPEHSVRTFKRDGKTWTEQMYRGNRRGTKQPIFHIDMFMTLAGRDDKGKSVVLVGDPRIADAMLDRDDRPRAGLYEAFDDVARQLRRKGFHVVRNPLPLVVSEDEDARERMWYFATSNNAIVQVERNTKTVWLPSYGHGHFKDLEITDNENKRIWKALGFRVHMLTDFHPYAYDLGAAHCIKKYLVR